MKPWETAQQMKDAEESDLPPWERAKLEAQYKEDVPDFEQKNETYVIPRLDHNVLASESPRSMEDFAHPYDIERSPMHNLNEMLGNIIPSTGQLAMDTTGAFMHPVETLQSLRQVINGMANKTGLWEGYDESSADAFLQYYADRYGGIENIGRTLRGDPAGFVADLAGFGSMLPGKAGSALRAIDPINKITNLGIKAAQKTGKAAAPWLTKGWLKSDAKMLIPEYDAIIDTALKRKTLPTEKSIFKLLKDKKAAGKRATAIAREADASGITVSPDTVPKLMSPLADEIGAYTHLDSVGNLKAMNRVLNKYLRSGDTPEFAPKKDLLPSELQQFKINAYDEIAYNRRNLRGASKATSEAQKALARSAKETLEVIDPRIAEPNRIFGELADLEDPLRKALKNRLGSKMVGLSPLIGANVGGWIGNAVAGPPGAVAGGAIGVGVGILDKPLPKALLGNAFNAVGNSKILKLFEKNRMPYPITRSLIRASDEEERDPNAILY